MWGGAIIAPVGKEIPASAPMGNHFLEGIRFLTETERSSLRALAADSPAALWGMMDASPEPFCRLLGRVRARRLSEDLWRMTTPEERRILKDRSFAPPPLGVVVDEEAPPLPAPDYDIETRDRLHGELQQLRSENSPDARRKADSVEQQLRMLLERSARSSKASGGSS